MHCSLITLLSERRNLFDVRHDRVVRQIFLYLAIQEGSSASFVCPDSSVSILSIKKGEYDFFPGQKSDYSANMPYCFRWLIELSPEHTTSEQNVEFGFFWSATRRTRKQKHQLSIMHYSYHYFAPKNWLHKKLKTLFYSYRRGEEHIIPGLSYFQRREHKKP